MANGQRFNIKRLGAVPAINAMSLCLMINVINLSLFIPLMNKWSLGIRDSGNQKHERHDLPFFNLTSWNPRTMHSMRCSSEHS